MFSMMIANSLPGSNNTWKMWVEHIVKQREKLGFQKACLMQHNGAVASTVGGFHPTAKETQVINKMFLESLNNNVSSEKLSIKDKTFVIKSLTSTQIIAFSGSKYVIVNRTKTKHVIALCDSKSKYLEAATWLNKLSQKLVEKDF